MMNALVNPEFSGDFIAVRGACAVAFTGESDTPRQVMDLLQEEIERMRREGVDPEVFMLVKNQMYGELLGDVEAVDDAAEEAAAACLKGRTLADEIAALAELTAEDANALMQTALREENRAYVQIDPAEKYTRISIKWSIMCNFPGLGLDLTVNRVALAIGGFNIYWYGVIIAAGMLLAMLYAFRNAVDYGIDSDRLVDVVAIGAVMSIVCARIYYVAMAPFEYQSLWEMVDIRKGGIAIYGAVIGAFVFGGLAAKWRKVPLLPLFDLVSLGFLIGQGIGRWGNFVNQEAFGTNTTLPWGMYSEGTEAYLKSVQVTLQAGVTVDPTAPVHPTFLYESIWCLLGFVVLSHFFKKRRFNGQIFLSYIIWYGLGRAWIEGLRTDSLLIGNTGLRASQLVAIGSVIVAAMLMVIGLRSAKGRELTVTLAVKDIKKQAEAGDRFAPDTLPANAPHAEFVKATDAMNERLDALDLNEVEIEEIEEPKE